MNSSLYECKTRRSNHDEFFCDLMNGIEIKELKQRMGGLEEEFYEFSTTIDNNFFMSEISSLSSISKTNKSLLKIV